MRLKNKKAIVTGSGSGIGRAIAKRYLDEGAKVLVAEIDEKKGQQTVDEIGGDARFLKVDVSKKSDIEKMIAYSIDELGGLDILVNNAGIVDFNKLSEISEEDWQSVIDVNLKGAFLASQAAVSKMAEEEQGKIINIASIAGLVGFGEIISYSAGKGGLIAMTKEMALELAPQGININAIAPGIIKTDMTKEMLKDDQTRKNLEANTPYNRLGEPEDIASAALYLASGEADFVNGHTLVVDGGWISK